MKSDKLLDDVKIIPTKRFADSRGFFAETWNRRQLEPIIGNIDFVQDNHSLSTNTHTLRGLHFQSPPHAQAKLVRVTRGAILDVVVDWRNGSASFGDWISVELSAENGTQLFVPVGFLHGFVTLKPMTEVVYKCSDYYAPECDGNIRFDDPELGIDWGITPDQAILSDKDLKAPRFAQSKSPFDIKKPV